MKILLSIKQSKEYMEKLSQDPVVQYNAGELLDYILEAQFVVLYKNKVLIEFEHIVLNAIVTLNSNYNSLLSKSITEGNLFTIQPDLERHFYFNLDGDIVNVTFPSIEQSISYTKEKFEFSLISMAKSGFTAIEFHLPSVKQNEAYIKLKSEIENYEFWRNRITLSN